MAFFGHFRQKMLFLVMAVSKHAITCSNILQNTFVKSTTLKIGWGALHPTTQAPKILF